MSLISKLNENFKSVADRLEKRMSEIEGNVEKWLSVKFNTVMHDRVQNEVCKLKDEINTEVNELKQKVVSVEKSNAEVASIGQSKSSDSVQKVQQHKLNVIVRNLLYDNWEQNNNDILWSKVAVCSQMALNFEMLK